MLNSMLYKTYTIVFFLMLVILLKGCSHIHKDSHKEPSAIYFSHSAEQSSEKITNNKKDESLVIYFDSDSAVLRPSDIDRLQSFIINFPEDELPFFLISGHTDSRLSHDYNIKLSGKRSENTRVKMIDMGVPKNKVATKNYGESYPIDQNQDAAGRQSNRRVVITTSSQSVGKS